MDRTRCGIVHSSLSLNLSRRLTIFAMIFVGAVSVCTVPLRGHWSDNTRCAAGNIVQFRDGNKYKANSNEAACMDTRDMYKALAEHVQLRPIGSNTASLVPHSFFASEFDALNLIGLERMLRHRLSFEWYAGGIFWDGNWHGYVRGHALVR